MNDKKKLLLCVGTRADAIKMCPLYLALKKADRAEPVLLSTGQHTDMCEGVLADFDLCADISLSLMKKGQSPQEVVERTQNALIELLPELAPALVLVHGDTASALGCALAASKCGYPIAHVEAGLRSGDERDPYPEEIYRKRISALACIHFAPTDRARGNLLAEGIEDERICVVGNTVTDALGYALEHSVRVSDAIKERCSDKTVLFTLHRRESLEQKNGKCAATRIFLALGRLLDENPQMNVIFPIHKNERVRELFSLSGVSNERLYVCEPLDYPTLIYTLARSRMVLTDSGGICEEAGCLGVPALILRDHTERQESLEDGCALLTTTNEDRIVALASAVYRDDKKRSALAHKTLSYGQGGVSERIARILQERV